MLPGSEPSAVTPSRRVNAGAQEGLPLGEGRGTSVS
jgi:hypothetical protein